MTSSRSAPLTGIAFVVLYVLAWTLFRSPDGNASATEIAGYYADNDHSNLAILSLYLFIAAGLVFLWFLAGLRSRLVAAEGEGGPLTSTAFAAGVVFVGLLLAGAVALASVPALISYDQTDILPDADVVVTMQSAGYGLILIGAMLSAAAMIAAVSVLTLRTQVLPAWSAWLGFVAAFALLFAVIWVPQIALLIWVLAISIASRKPSGLPAT